MAVRMGRLKCILYLTILCVTVPFGNGKCIATLQEKDRHCHLQNQAVVFTCMYSHPSSDMSRADIYLRTAKSAEDGILNSIILGSNTIRAIIERFGDEYEGEVSCRYDKEECDCPRYGYFRELQSCTGRVFSERPPIFPREFSCFSDINYEYIDCTLDTERSACWAITMSSKHLQNVACTLDDGCPLPGPSYDFESIVRFCMKDDAARVTWHVHCPWHQGNLSESEIKFVVTSRKYNSYLSRVYTWTLDFRMIKLERPFSIDVINITSNSATVQFEIDSCKSNIGVICHIQQQPGGKEPRIMKTTPTTVCNNSSISIETTIENLSPNTFYQMLVTCAIDGGQHWSEPSSVNFTTKESNPIIGPILKSNLYQFSTCNTSKSCLLLYWKNHGNDVTNGQIKGYKVQVTDVEDRSWEEDVPDVQTAAIYVGNPHQHEFHVSVWSINDVGTSLNASHEKIIIDEGVPEITCVDSVLDPWYDTQTNSHKVTWSAASDLPDYVIVIYYYCLGYVVQSTVQCTKHLDWVTGNVTEHSKTINVTAAWRRKNQEWHFGVALDYLGRSKGITWDIKRCPSIPSTQSLGSQLMSTSNVIVVVTSSIVAIILVIIGGIFVLKCLRRKWEKTCYELRVTVPSIPLNNIPVEEYINSSFNIGVDQDPNYYESTQIDNTTEDTSASSKISSYIKQTIYSPSDESIDENDTGNDCVMNKCETTDHFIKDSSVEDIVGGIDYKQPGKDPVEDCKLKHQTRDVKSCSLNDTKSMFVENLVHENEDAGSNEKFVKRKQDEVSDKTFEKEKQDGVSDETFVKEKQNTISEETYLKYEYNKRGSDSGAWRTLSFSSEENRDEISYPSISQYVRAAEPSGGEAGNSNLSSRSSSVCSDLRTECVRRFQFSPRENPTSAQMQEQDAATSSISRVAECTGYIDEYLLTDMCKLPHPNDTREESLNKDQVYHSQDIITPCSEYTDSPPLAIQNLVMKSLTPSENVEPGERNDNAETAILNGHVSNSKNLVKESLNVSDNDGYIPHEML